MEMELELNVNITNWECFGSHDINAIGGGVEYMSGHVPN